MIAITKINGVGCNEIREYALQSPNTLLYSEPRFLALVAEHLNASAYWLKAHCNGVILGLLPYLVKDGPLGHVFNSLAYYGSNGGVIQTIPDDETKAVLIKAFYEEAEKANAVSATIITNPLLGDAEVYDLHTNATFRDERIGQITHFPSLTHADDLIHHFQNPRPRNIRRAMKEGVIVKKEHKNALDFLYKTHVDNIVAIDGLPKKAHFFEAITKHLNQNEWAVFTGFIKEKPVAALLLFYCNKTVEYFTPVIVGEYRYTQALAFVIYTAMQDAIQGQYKNWNWGGTWLSQSGVYDFKKRWGTTEYRYYYHTRVFNQKLTTCNPEFISKSYPGFFLIPYKNLAR